MVTALVKTSLLDYQWIEEGYIGNKWVKAHRLITAS